MISAQVATSSSKSCFTLFSLGVILRSKNIYIFPFRFPIIILHPLIWMKENRVKYINWHSIHQDINSYFLLKLKILRIFHRISKPSPMKSFFLLILISLCVSAKSEKVYFNFTDVSGGIFTFGTSDPLVIQHAQVLGIFEFKLFFFLISSLRIFLTEHLTQNHISWVKLKLWKILVIPIGGNRFHLIFVLFSSNDLVI